MTPNALVRDLIVLVADRNMEATVTGILNHHQKLGMRPIQFDVQRHPETDAGCRSKGAQYLAAFAKQYRYAILMFDHEGCGREDVAPGILEQSITEELLAAGWQGSATAIVIVPELDVWVWSDSPNVDGILGWKGRSPKLRQWLMDERYLLAGNPKPVRPKEALEAALKAVRLPRSSDVYAELAASVGYNRCTDRAFTKLRTTLQTWFPEGHQ